MVADISKVGVKVMVSHGLVRVGGILSSHHENYTRCQDIHTHERGKLQFNFMVSKSEPQG